MAQARGSGSRGAVKVSDKRAEEPGAGVSEAVLPREFEVEIAVRSSDRVTPDRFGGCARCETDVLRQHKGEMRVH